MDQKNQIIARLQQRFAASSLPGAVTRVEEKKARAAVAARYGHLAPEIRSQIDEMLALEERYHLRCFVTDDQCRAGIIIPRAVRDHHWPAFLRYSRLFFGPAHEAISTVFVNELQAVARHYGKNQLSDKETV